MSEYGLTARQQRILQKWRQNMAVPAEQDAAFEAFLEGERQEIDEILASLDAEKHGKQRD